MSFFTKKRISFWVILFLLATNIATIGTILYHRHKFRNSMHEHNPRQKLHVFVVKELGFSGDQLMKFESLEKASKEKHMQLFERLDKSRKSLFDELSSAKLSEQKLDSLIQDIAVASGEMSKTGFGLFVATQHLCNDNQKLKLMDFFKKQEAEHEKEMTEMKERMNNIDEKK